MPLPSLLLAPPEVTPPPGRHRPKRGKQSKFLLMPKAATRCCCHNCYESCQRSLHCQVGIGLIKWGRKHVLVNACSCYKMDQFFFYNFVFYTFVFYTFVFYNSKFISSLFIRFTFYTFVFYTFVFYTVRFLYGSLFIIQNFLFQKTLQHFSF